MHKILFPLELCPRPRSGSLQRSPDPLAVYKGRGLLLKAGWAKREGEGEEKGRRMEEEGKVRGGEEKEGEGQSPPPQISWPRTAPP